MTSDPGLGDAADCVAAAAPSGGCQHCLRRTERALVDLSDAYHALREPRVLAPGAATGVRVGARGRTGNEPLQLRLLVMSDTVAEVLTGWEDRIRARFGLSPRRAHGVRQQSAVDRAVHTLSVWLGRLWADGEIGTELAGDLCRLRAAAHRTLGWHHVAQRLPVPCPDCDLLTLVRHSGDDRAVCTACGAQSADDMDGHHLGPPEDAPGRLAP